MVSSNGALSMRLQCELLGVNRSSLYYVPVEPDTEELEVMRRMDELHLEHPAFGSRMLMQMLKGEGQVINRKRVQRLMRLMGLESMEIKDEFLKKGIQLCVDGLALDFIKDSLLRERDQYIERLEEGGRFFKVLGDAAPAFGMIGTLVGLVQMLSNMEDPAAIGPSMAVALLTTLYGALISNLIAIPISEKMVAKLATEELNRSLIIEGVIHIHNKTNPDIMVDFLNAYLPESQRIAISTRTTLRLT